MPIPVGTSGGFKGRAIDVAPDRRGNLACVVAMLDEAVELSLSFGETGSRRLLRLELPDAARTPGKPRPRGWVALEREGRGYRALLSRASSAVRVQPFGARVVLLTSGEALGVVDGRARRVELASEAPRLSEPWVVLHAAEGDEVVPVLVTFTRRVASSSAIAGGVELCFDEPPAVHAMPLEGIRRRRPGEEPLEHWVACARSWVRPLLAMPVACVETPSLAGDRVRVVATFEHERLIDAWGNQPEPLAPLPPALAEIAAEGYPVSLPPALATGDAQRNFPTLVGPYQFVAGCELEYGLPVPPGIKGIPPSTRADGAWAEPVRAELHRLVAGLGPPTPDYVDNNLRIMTFLADARGLLSDEEASAAARYAAATLEGALARLHGVSEPLTDQAWYTLDNTWRAKFDDDASPWARDNERFDSEFYNGQALSSLLAAEELVPGAIGAYYPRALDLYRYFELFFDWATGAALTHATGDSSNIDGMLFAFEGMVAMARMAALQGDAGTELDATYRAARQLASIYGLFCHQAYAAEHDYAVGHVSRGRLPPAEVDARFPIDAWVTEHGCAVSEPRSFWNCTGFVFYANRPLQEFYRTSGLLDRLGLLLLDAMPALHPRWFDGDATDAHGENGQTRYGTSWTAAHLHARASLFGEDPVALFALYEATKQTPAEQTWYRMTLPQIAGPLMLALLEAPPPPAAT
jgi:hypothetical protein